MRSLNLRLGALLGALLSAPLIAVMYLAGQLAGLPFVPFDLFDWITRILPGPVITFGIDLMIDTLLFLGISVADTAKLAEQAAAILQFLMIGIFAGILFAAVISWRRTKPDALTGLILGALLGLPLIAISLAISQSTVAPSLSILWLALLFLTWGLTYSRAYGRLTAPAPVVAAEPVRDRVLDVKVRAAQPLDRRTFLIQLGASTATITVLGAGVGAILARSERQRQAAALEQVPRNRGMAHNAEAGSHLIFPNANDPVIPAPRTRPEYTPIEDHYKVFIRTEPSVIDGETWRLPITGMVDTPLMLTLDELRNNYAVRDQYVTISCVSGRIGTDLISTTLWTGASVQEVLADAGVQEGARYLRITSADGFHETVPLDLINADERIMFCYGWDGNSLPIGHGFPLRIWIPDRYGMKQPKWIVGVEVTDTYTPGYWVERNWDEIAQVKTTSVIDTIAIEALYESGGQQLVPIGGIAFAGARQISRVELRVDGGPWQEAQLRSPLSETTWVIWRYDWPFQAGDHTFEVRCAEGDGTPQIEARQPGRPSGATGIHLVEADL